MYCNGERINERYTSRNSSTSIAERDTDSFTQCSSVGSEYWLVPWSDLGDLDHCDRRRDFTADLWDCFRASMLVLAIDTMASVS